MDFKNNTSSALQSLQPLLEFERDCVFCVEASDTMAMSTWILYFWPLFLGFSFGFLRFLRFLMQFFFIFKEINSIFFYFCYFLLFMQLFPHFYAFFFTFSALFPNVHSFFFLLLMQFFVLLFLKKKETVNFFLLLFVKKKQACVFKARIAIISSQKVIDAHIAFDNASLTQPFLPFHC